ncbi:MULTISPECIES: hypothetical protein [unclassified Arthrobacter]|uniref:hypothetical protein n=1 Tax=unclassified Arthrobacter TaxID=235627 RepID=UPI001492577B|nr:MULTISPECIES: hypothetical protein [unclassified Arthrobacter]MBE0010246.1 hypothetical protein [Arthrobacter sp. AET 35A]NOJ64123.1 hypothetical protein [Arthrobacter sp. 147(2020)]
MDENWIEHRRPGGDRIGWIRMCGEGFVAHDALGTEITEEVDWLSAEEALDEKGLAFLADMWVLDLPGGQSVHVRIAEAGPSGIRVQEDDLGAAAAVGSDVRHHSLPFPAPNSLRRL